MSAPAVTNDEACPSDDEVLALVCGELPSSALARLVRHTERCPSCALVVAEAGLARGESEPLPASRTLARSSGAVFVAGQLVASRYLIERRLGRGGMGEVYAALDQELGERVALKTIATSLALDPLAVQRFKLELRLARSVSHPSVCRVFDLGRHELGGGAAQWFFTLQLLEGASLRRHMAHSGPPRLELALSLAEQLAWGLQAIHDQNVVHRDIKPENVMLTSQASPAAAIWVDFGLARVDLRDTRSARVLAGTPDYFAPELLRGAVASRASDLYAFGVLLFELLTGALPFSRTASLSEALERRQRATPPSALRSDLPPALDALVLRCLESDPVRRLASAQQLAEHLREVAQDLSCEESVSAPLGVVEDAPRRRWLKRSAIALAGLGLVAAMFWEERQLSAPAPAEAQLPASPAASQLPPSIASTPASPESSPYERRPSPRRSAASAASASATAARAPAPTAVDESPPVPDYGGRR